MVKVVYVGLTDECNLGCRYCFINKLSYQRTMSNEVVKSGINYCFKEFRPKQWSFQGGEVFLFPELLLFALKEVRKWDSQCILTITTNGTKPFTNELLEFVKVNNVQVRVSMDNFPEINNKVRGKSFDTLGFILDAIVQKLDIQMCITITPENVVGISNWVKFLINLGINWFVLFPVVEAGWSDEFLKYYKDELGKINQLYTYYNVNQIEDKSQVAFCGRHNQQVWLDKDGGLWPCHMAYYKASEIEVVTGQLPKIGNIWEGVDIRKMRYYNKWELSHREQCIACGKYDSCQMCWVGDLLGNKKCPSEIACRLNS